MQFNGAALATPTWPIQPLLMRSIPRNSDAATSDIAHDFSELDDLTIDDSDTNELVPDSHSRLVESSRDLLDANLFDTQKENLPSDQGSDSGLLENERNSNNGDKSLTSDDQSTFDDDEKTSTAALDAISESSIESGQSVSKGPENHGDGDENTTSQQLEDQDVPIREDNAAEKLLDNGNKVKESLQDQNDSAGSQVVPDAVILGGQENSIEDQQTENAGLLDGHEDLKSALLASEEGGGSDDPLSKHPDEPGLDFPWPTVVSVARQDWGYKTSALKNTNAALDELMVIVGLETIKRQFVQIHTLIDTAKRQKLDSTSERFGAVFIGNPGTGKSTVAKFYAKFLYIEGVVPSDELEVITGTRLVSEGVQGCIQLVDKVNQRGGVLLVEEAHDLVPTEIGSGTGGSILNFMLSEIDKLKGRVVFLFAGHGKKMEALRGHNPVFSSLIPILINFPNYLDPELHLLLVHEMKLKFKETVTVEGGYYGRYMRIIARRLGRGRARNSFGNARDVQAMVSLIHSRQADRLFSAMKGDTHKNADDFILTREDLIGRPPSSAFTTSKAWNELQAMIGLKSVKETIGALIHRLQLNYERELSEMPLIECSLNKLFLGNPGTGKTTVAKLYGQILVDIGLLSSGEVQLKTPADLIGDALGQSERNTKAILDAAKGKVLIIDEAYMLGKEDKGFSSSDPYRTAVIDTIVGEVQSTAVEDRCVLLLGYRDRMEAMINEGNPALARRFPLASAFFFEDYSKEELRQIIKLKLDRQGFRTTDEAEETALEVLELARNRPGFGNGGEVDIILDQAKVRQHRRLLASKEGKEPMDLFLPSDFDPDFERGTRSLLDVGLQFANFVGNESVIEKLKGYQRIVRKMKELSKRAQNTGAMAGIKDPREVIPFTFLFCGPPGTGKTTTANKMGELFYDLGFLATKDVVECSATDLVGQYVGHTGPKTRRLFDSALGRVLFIDEAYKLAEGPYGKEATTEIINNLTKERYRNKIVLILAGYEHDINKLMAINPGLTSRFPVMLKFDHLSVTYCIRLLTQCLEDHGLDAGVIGRSEYLVSSLSESFEELSRLRSWGNARDIQTLAKAIYQRVLADEDDESAPCSTTLRESLILEEVDAMKEDRRERHHSASARHVARVAPPWDHWQPTMPPPMPPSTYIRIEKATRRDDGPEELEKEAPKIKMAQEKNQDGPGSEEDDKSMGEGPPSEVERDPDISNEVWDQLQADRRAARDRRANLEASRKFLKFVVEQVARHEVSLITADGSPDVAKIAQERLRVSQKEYEKWKERLEQKEEEERFEKEIQELLSGKCPLGYGWIRQENGYRCAGGTHFATFEQIRSGDIERCYSPAYSSDWSD